MTWVRFLGDLVKSASYQLTNIAQWKRKSVFSTSIGYSLKVGIEIGSSTKQSEHEVS